MESAKDLDMAHSLFRSTEDKSFMCPGSSGCGARQGEGTGIGAP